MTLGLPETVGHQRIGMVGGSYGGGIQLVTATLDPRIDAIVPGIAWNTLNSSLYPKDVFKSAWGTLLILDLIEAGATINPQIYEGILTGALLGFLTPSQQALLARSGTGTTAGTITAPTLLIQGTADGLFPLQEAVTNQQLLAEAGTTGEDDLVLRRPRGMPQSPQPHPAEAHPERHAGVAGPVRQPGPHQPRGRHPEFPVGRPERPVLLLRPHAVRPAFPGHAHLQVRQWRHPADRAVHRRLGTRLRVFGQPLSLFDAALLSTATAAPAANAINLTVPVPTGTQIVGAPQLTFTYSGLGTGRSLYAQIVDDKTGLVLGNLATPIPVTLDGQSHTVTADLGTLNSIAYTAVSPDSTLTVQLVSTATQYENLTSYGVVSVSNMTLSLPTVAAGVDAPVDV